MLFSRIVSFLAVSATLGGLALATPTPIEERGLADLQRVISNLKSSTGKILPELNKLAADGRATEANVVPLMDQLAGAFDNARNSLINEVLPRDLPPSIEKRQASNFAQPVAEIIRDTARTLDVVRKKGKNIPHFPDHVHKIDLCLRGFVIIFGGLVPGLLGLVGGLLATVGTLLTGVGLSLVFGGIFGIFY